jgi:N-glycosylase/DNA lyase
MLRHMLRLDCDLAPFHALCRREPRLAWAAERGAGRLLRSASVFEDLLKLLFTTNTAWAGTESMTRKLVLAAGSPAPSGARAFPTPRQCLRDVAFYRDVVRAGYRAEAAVALAQAFADGRLDDATFLRPQPADELWRRLVALRGFGPYAAGQAMRLLGHYEHLALDSWCRARLAELDGTRRPPRDAAIARRYAPFEPFQGLALWLDLTADWHASSDPVRSGSASATSDRPRT